MDEPYPLNPGVGGKKGYLPRTMAIVCIMLEAERRTYRKMVRCLHADQKTARRMELLPGNIPSKNMIRNSYWLIPVLPQGGVLRASSRSSRVWVLLQTTARVTQSRVEK